jgi:RNA 2',3'-cyclic 3'-phosphodiesterase
VRCFLAIELPGATIDTLTRVGDAIRKQDPAWAGEKWVAPEVMHITLRFLGELDTSSVDRVVSAFASVASSQLPFPLGPAAVRAVPKAGRASMLWAVLDDPTRRCGELAEIADNVAVGEGLESDTRPFVPHITLVRARRPRPVSDGVFSTAAEQLRLAELQPMSVASATLFSSVLTPHGPIHERLARFALGTQEGQP